MNEKKNRSKSGSEKIAETVIYLLTNDKTYKYVQASSKARDGKKETRSEPEIKNLPLIKAGIEGAELFYFAEHRN